MILTLEQIEKLADGSATMARFGEPIKTRLYTAKQRAIYEEAKTRGYFVTGHRGTVGNAPYQLWDYWCEAVGKPIARIEMHGKYAHLSLDFICFPRERKPTFAVCEAAAQIIRSYPFAAKYVRAANGHFGLGDTYWHVSKWPKEHAEDLMTRLLELVK